MGIIVPYLVVGVVVPHHAAHDRLLRLRAGVRTVGESAAVVLAGAVAHDLLQEPPHSVSSLRGERRHGDLVESGGRVVTVSVVLDRRLGREGDGSRYEKNEKETPTKKTSR